MTKLGCKGAASYPSSRLYLLIKFCARKRISTFPKMTLSFKEMEVRISELNLLTQFSLMVSYDVEAFQSSGKIK